MEITENIENEAEAARSPGEVKKEIRKLRHKAERPLYWILFVMNILILLCAFVFTMAMQSSDLSGFIDDPDIIELLQTINGGIVFFYLAYVIIAFLCAFYQLYASELSYAIKVTPRNFPEIYEKSVEFSKNLGMKKVPEVYIRQQNGILNAFSAWVIGKRYVQLNSEIVDIAYMENKDFDTLYFVMAHEFGHHYFNHVTLAHSFSFLLPRIIPILGPLYSRSQEYTADRVAQVLTESTGIKCMAMLSAGRHLYPYVDAEDYLENIYRHPNVLERLGRWIVNLTVDHPIAPFRVAAIVDPEQKSGRLI